MLARRYEVITASSGHEAITKFEREGPFPVVLSDFSMPGMDGLQLLREVHRHAPETVGILLTGLTGSDVAVAACHESGVYRYLTKPCGFEAMVQAIDEAIAHHDDLESAGIDSERLLFAKESLENFTDLLEKRIDQQSTALRRLHAFAVELCAANSLRDIVKLAANATHDVLGGRGVHVQVWDSEASSSSIAWGAGPEMSSSMCEMPLKTKDGLIGQIVVDVEGPRGSRLADADMSLLASIASSTAVAAHNEFRRRERDHAQHATILALARLAEQRDNETGKHLERVAAYCTLVAEGLRTDAHYTSLITDEWILDLERSSALHDIGKVGIPDSILLKPGKLTPEEWEIMKTHAEIGAQTLDHVIAQFGNQGFLTMGRDIAWCHHEKWDGSGYPRGISGPVIPLSARILALADVYDALTTVRPYKQAWSHEDALDWIRQRAGAHFDPEVVDTFLAHQSQADVIRRRLQDEPDVDARDSVLHHG